jgi:hypothetical protein
MHMMKCAEIWFVEVLGAGALASLWIDLFSCGRRDKRAVTCGLGIHAYVGYHAYHGSACKPVHLF